MDDQQADPGEPTGISTSSSSSTPPQSSSCRSGGDEPDKIVGAGARGSASRRRERGADQQLSRNRLNNKEGHGGVRFQAAGHIDQDGGSTVQAADGAGRVGDPADEITSTARRFQAKHDQGGRSMGPPLHKKKMGQQADQQETSTGISTSRAPPPAGRSGDDADNNFDGGVVLRASRPLGRWAADYRPSRNRLSEGYYYGGVRDLRPDEGFRFQAAGQYDLDGGSMVQAADGAGRIRDPADENTVRFQAAGHDLDGRSMIGRAPPPAGRSGDEPDHNFDGGVVLGASRPRGRWAADYRPSRNRPNEGGYYYGGGVRDFPDEDFRFQDELEEYYGYMGPSHTRMDHQAEGETTGTGSSTPPPPPCRSGGQPDNFVGGLLRASRPRGRWAADYRPSRNRPNRGYGGVRDLRPDEGDRFQAAGHDQDGRSTVQGDGGGVHFQAEQQEDGCIVRSPDGGVRDQADGDTRSQAEHESGSAVPADGGVADPADGGFRFRGEHEDGGLRVYDNVVVGDPSGVIFGRRNYAGGKVRGQVSGNRVFR